MSLQCNNYQRLVEPSIAFARTPARRCTLATAHTPQGDPPVASGVGARDAAPGPAARARSRYRAPMHALIDSHSHIDVHEFAEDRATVLARARAAGVGVQIVPAIAASGWGALRELCAGEKGLHPAYGLHPMYLAEHREQDLSDLPRWLAGDDCVALGECGLDFHVEGLDAGLQRHYFVRQLELARDAGLPVVIHARRAVDEVIATLRRVRVPAGGVVHSFPGSAEQAQQLYRLGFCLGIGGPLTYERANRLRALVRDMPLEFLLLETDSPDQPLSGHRGERNEPAYLVEVLATVAALRGVDESVIAQATTDNARRLFRL